MSTTPQRIAAGGGWSLGAAESAYVVVKQRITAGRYRSGERLAIDLLRAELRVSKQPIMEALRRLSAEGLVTIVPQVGCHVATIAHADVVDFFAIMGAVEGRAAALAATRRTDAQLRELAQTSAQIGEIAALAEPQDRADRYLALNRRFHSIIHQMSGTAIVEELGRGFYDRADFFINGSTARSPMENVVAARHADHEGIRVALENGDADRAEVAARAHILGTVALIEAALGQAP
jgi:DNA-binding GntR family transcriptional regulator